MVNDENTALLNALSDLLEAADGKVDSVLKIIKNATIPDKVIKKVAESAPAFNSAISLTMAKTQIEISELAQLHMINHWRQSSGKVSNLTSLKSYVSSTVNIPLISRC
ncbi:unnamed protein product [Peronospora farinosa]|uniref:Uncharacterized protein n=1 Tax=Peronospora farinosa TaxID=134698 RepID=A0AAV0UZ23_9STRA|nr:unnamed protein product [Peronospora farinosa]CAI5740616.1 unnamed protein product [Peronospora farinosa]